MMKQKTVIIPNQKLNKAMSLIDSGDYTIAYELLEEIGDYKTIAQSIYDRAIMCLDEGDYESGVWLLQGLNYKDSEKLLSNYKQIYQKIVFSKSKVGDIVEFGTYEVVIFGDLQHSWTVFYGKR